MIITRLIGGLGNQMFAYAAGLALAQMRRTVLKLDVSWYREENDDGSDARYGLSAFKIVEQFATAEEIRQQRGPRPTRPERAVLGLARLLRLRGLLPAERGATVHSEAEAPVDPAFFRLPDHTYLQGLWQSERYFEPVADLLRQHFSFRYPPHPAVISLAQRIQSGASIAVHVRRGDYRLPRYRDRLGLVGPEYYRQAISEIRAHDPQARAFVFSDEIDSVETEFSLDGPHEFVRLPPTVQPPDVLRLMSSARHAVLANSTFSWWSAWLNPAPDRLVIAPDPWSRDGGHREGLVRTDWRRRPPHFIP